jgi:ribosomal protein L11 methyltransferase
VNYIEINVTLDDPSKQDSKESVIALLSEHPFDSFAEHENGISAYIPVDLYNKEQIHGSLNEISQMFPFSWEIKKIEEENWNLTWEENYQAVTIAGKCHIRAPFHPANHDMDFDLVIEPKMSFGTAHHETTSMMIELLLEEDVSGKNVLDMGCGTGVLAILAAKKGAKNVLAIDNDEWAYKNSLENADRNDCPYILVKMGDEQVIGNTEFDLIIANINRNILLQQIDKYAEALKPDGKIFMSGFYEADIPVLLAKAKPHGLKLQAKQVKNHWSAIVIG